MTVSHYEVAWCTPRGKLEIEKVYRESEVPLVVATARVITRGPVQVLRFTEPEDISREYESCNIASMLGYAR